MNPEREDWMELRIRVPGDEGQRLLKFAQAELGLEQIDEDWCTQKRRRDNAVIDYAPCPEPPDRKVGW